MSQPPPMIVPIIIPASQPETCPECGKPEKIVTTCGHCGHEYKDEASGNVLVQFLIAAAVVILFVWFFVTVAIWATEGDDTLVSMFASQWKWVRSLEVW